MNIQIDDDILIKKVVEGKLKREVAYLRYDLSGLKLKEQILFCLKRVMEIPMCQSRVVIDFWENTEVIVQWLEQHRVENYQLQRKHRAGHITPGRISISVSRMDEFFFKDLIAAMYGYRFSLASSLNVVFQIAANTGGEIIIIAANGDNTFVKYIINTTDETAL